MAGNKRLANLDESPKLFCSIGTRDRGYSEELKQTLVKNNTPLRLQNALLRAYKAQHQDRWNRGERRTMKMQMTAAARVVTCRIHS